MTEDDKILFPAGRMNETEQNIRANNRVKMTICNREVQGISYKGTGFLVIGTAEFAAKGPDYDTVKAKFPWARAARRLRSNPRSRRYSVKAAGKSDFKG
ncbi:pyridoxamine 5'-phosphate oxidase family protein [Salmonella enterica subsp. enterica serovar Senftenberg]|nr:pyridoxamine 5'-phosphate oxidase family protein [Salmonella enterica subsp. enterica serovar Senftenberg]